MKKFEFEVSDFKSFVVTGITVNKKRFKQKYNSYFIAMSINLYRGHVWGVKENGKRTMLKEVFN